MKNLLLLNLIIQRLIARLKPARLFIQNLFYFLLNMRDLKPGTYIINPRVIMQKKYIKHQHFKKTTLDLYPRVTIYNFCGSKNSAVSMVGFHPDLRYTIDFSAQMVIKSFNVDVNLENYSKKRSAMSKYIVAPSYYPIDAKQYSEELILGKSFNIGNDNYYKFKELLANYKMFLENSAKIHMSKENNKKWVDPITNRLAEQIPLNSALFEELIMTNYICLSKGSDIAGPNIIESAEGLVLIDWEPKELKYRRFWVDIINLILKCDPNGYMQGKYESYLREIFSAFGINNSMGNEAEDNNAIILASFLTNLKNIDHLDLVDDDAHFPCRGLSSIRALDLQKVCRSTKRFLETYMN